MVIKVEIQDADALLADLVSQVEAGSIVIITRADIPVARLGPVESNHRRDVREAVRRIRALRNNGGISAVTVDEILAWRHESHLR